MKITLKNGQVKIMEIKSILKKRKKIFLIIAKNLILIKFINPGINYTQNFIRNKSNEEK